MLLQAVRVAVHDDYDRVTFELVPRSGQEAKVPHWQVEPARPPLLQDGSGEPIQVRGSAFLSVLFWASGVDLSGPRFREVYTGPKRFQPTDTRTLQDLRHAGDFENVLTWYAGLRRAACFTVLELRDPVRIAVDVSHRELAGGYPTARPAQPTVGAPAASPPASP